MRKAVAFMIVAAMLGLIANVAWITLDLMTFPDGGAKKTASLFLTNFSYVANLFSNVGAVVFFITFYRYLKGR